MFNNMKNCIECNESLDDDAKFCSNCRAEQPEKEIEAKEPKPAKKASSVKKSTAKKPAVVKPLPKKSNYQEIKQAIYEMTSQDNCGECGCNNCMQFAMQAASPKNTTEWSECPYIDEEEAEEILASLDDEGNEDGNAQKQKLELPDWKVAQQIGKTAIGSMLGFMGELAKKYPKK
jgi:ArsR family metal-binding transcriptional regulator